MLLRILVALTFAFAAARADTLSFQIREGLNLNSFVRDGHVAAHVVLRSGQDPRILVAFPAGNSGVAVWFAHNGTDVHWTLVNSPVPITIDDTRGRPLYGVRFDAVIDAPTLTIKQAILSNVRVLRDYQSGGIVTQPVMTNAVATERTLTWKRDRLDGAAGYYLQIAVREGKIGNGTIEAGSRGIALSVTAATGDPPLDPLSEAALLNEKASPDPNAREALAFLSYKEKFLAGSWRFNTYFGRDTLLSLRLLMPVLRPEAIDDGLRSVLSRLSSDGDVAHEEDISEFAILDHMRTQGTRSDAPVFDYKMVDETLLLAPVAAAWLLEDARGKSGATAFLASRDPRTDGPVKTCGADLVRNLLRVVQEGRPFAADPRAANLIGLKSGQNVGDWRDSGDGLGGGRYPYDVNAVLMPAALSAVARLLKSGLLDPYLTAEDRPVFAGARAMARVWQAKASPLFAVNMNRRQAAERVSAYAAEISVSAGRAVQSLPQHTLRFNSVSLDANGKPVPILNSDGGFALLFTDPDPTTLERIVSNAMRPFPAGLMTDAGMLTANPAFADDALRSRFGRNAYHGAVVWSWQQAMFAAGLARQLSRTDLPSPVRVTLNKVQRLLWHIIDRNRHFANSELWSWTFMNGRYSAVPFGDRSSDADESDAVQLWSTVYLAIPHPHEQRVPSRDGK